MAIKSVVEIDIQDQKFKEFQKLFEKYQGQVKQTASAWRDTSKESGKFIGAMEGISALLLAQTEFLHHHKEDTQAVARNVLGASMGWKSIASSAKNTASSVASTTRTLSRWLGLGSLAGSLLGVGGLFGIEALAGRAANQRRSALGLGVSTAEQSAFGLAFGRIGDAGGFLGNVADARSNLAQRGVFYRLGMTDNDLATKSTADIAIMAMQRGRDLFIQGGQTEQAMQGNGLQNLGGLEWWRAAAGMSNAEIANQVGSYGTAKDKLGRDDATGRKWTDFMQAIGTIESQIENVLINALSPLAGPLGHLADKIGDSIKKLLSDHPDALPSLIEHVGVLVNKVTALIDRWLGGTGGSTSGVSDSPAKIPGRPDWIPASPFVPAGGPMSAFDAGYFQKAWKNKVTPGMSDEDYALWALSMVESSGDPNAKSKAGAIGLMQLTPDTAKDMGVGNIWDPAQNYAGGKKRLAQMLQMYGGDWEQAIAAYNMGPGGPKSEGKGLYWVMKTWGNKWREHVPAETKSELEHMEGYMHGPLNQVHITLNNRTGSSATVTTAAMGPGFHAGTD